MFLMLGIVATTVSQQFLGAAVDAFGTTPQTAALWVVIALVAAYAMSRVLMQAFAQLRDGVFAKVQYHAMREVAVETFAHVHTLSMRFHLERKTGGLSPRHRARHPRHRQYPVLRPVLGVPDHLPGADLCRAAAVDLQYLGGADRHRHGGGL